MRYQDPSNENARLASYEQGDAAAMAYEQGDALQKSLMEDTLEQEPTLPGDEPNQ